MSTIEFSETQYFRRLWAWGAVLAFNILFIYAIVQQLILGKPFGNKPASDMVLILLEIIPLLLLILLFSIKLKTSINEQGICYRYYPFQFKTTCIEWHELADAYMRPYQSLYEYGGWGIRIGDARTGRAINTSQSGNIGLQLQFANGKLLLIGTRRPAEIEKMIEIARTDGRIKRRV